MSTLEGNLNPERAVEFRRLVENLVKNSSLFPLKTIGKEELGILDVIESNEVTLYVPENASDRMLDAVHCLIEIYDELGKETPDEDSINQTVSLLKEYL